MTYRAVLKEVDGKPAAFIGSRTGREDAEVVLLRVGDREETTSGQRWASAPPWTGKRPSWAGGTRQAAPVSPIGSRERPAQSPKSSSLKAPQI